MAALRWWAADSEWYKRLDDVLPGGAGALARRSVSCGGITLPALVAFYRILVCSLAIAFLWCTSLSVARSITGAFVTSPSFGAVVSECTRAYDEVKRQRTAHNACARRQIATCDATLHAALEVETARWHLAAKTNRELVTAAAERAERCERRRIQALDRVHALQSAGIALARRGDSELGRAV